MLAQRIIRKLSLEEMEFCGKLPADSVDPRNHNRWPVLQGIVGTIAETLHQSKSKLDAAHNKQTSSGR